MFRGLSGALARLESAMTALVKSASANVNFGGIILTYSINEAKWKALPPELRKIVQEQADKAVLEGCGKLDAELGDAVKKIEAAGGRFFAFGEDDTRRLEEVFETVRKDWAAGLDKRGKPGTAVLTAWQEAVKAVRENPE